MTICIYYVEKRVAELVQENKRLWAQVREDHKQEQRL